MIKRLAYRLLSICLALLLIATQVAANDWLINSYRFAAAGPPLLTVTDECNAIGTTSTATLVTGATCDAAVDDWLVAIVASDNAGTSGAVSLTSVTDSASNTWYERGEVNLTGGGVSSGATLSFYTTKITNALTSGTVTANYSPNTTAKTIEVYRVQPSGGAVISFVAADNTGTNGSAGMAIAGNSVSVTSGDTIFGAAAWEGRTSAVTITGDSDTTNGSWTSILSRSADLGSSFSSMTGSYQYKTVTATGTQQWQASLSGGADWIASYLILSPNPQPATISFLQCSAEDTSSPYSFATQNTGTASEDRYTLVGVSAEDSAATFTVTAVSVGSDPADPIVDQGGSNSMDAAFYILANPAGTSETVDVTTSEGVTAVIVCLWKITGLTSATPTASTTATIASANALSLDINVSALGVAAAICSSQNAGQTMAWTGTMTGSYTATTNMVTGYGTATNDASADTPMSIICDPSGVTNGNSGASVSFF